METKQQFIKRQYADLNMDKSFDDSMRQVRIIGHMLQTKHCSPILLAKYNFFVLRVAAHHALTTYKIDSTMRNKIRLQYAIEQLSMARAKVMRAVSEFYDNQ